MRKENKAGGITLPVQSVLKSHNNQNRIVLAHTKII